MFPRPLYSEKIYTWLVLLLFYFLSKFIIDLDSIRVSLLESRQWKLAVTGFLYADFWNSFWTISLFVIFCPINFSCLSLFRFWSLSPLLSVIVGPARGLLSAGRAESWDRHSTCSSMLLLFSQRTQICCSVPFVWCLKTVISCILSHFLVDYAGRPGLLLSPVSWLKVEVYK